jgi:ABC-type multidrug transport system fused ATPase/permease subunit
MSTRQEYYHKRVERFEQELQSIDKKVTLLARLRLAVIITAVLIVFYQSYVPYFYIALLFLAGTFLYLVKRFAEQEELQQLITFKLKLNRQELNYVSAHQSPDLFPAMNSTTERDDLDIFGTHSLFQAISRISSPTGRKRLAQLLSPERIPDAQHILGAHEANKELEGKDEFRQHFIALTNHDSDENMSYDSLLQWASEAPRMKTSYFAVLRYAWTIISIGGAVAALYFNMNWLFTPIIILAWGINGRFKSYCDQLSETIGKHDALMKKYATVFHAIEEENFQARALKELQAKALDAAVGVKALSEVSARFDSRKNVLGNFLLTTFGLYDLQCINEAELWRNKYGQQVAGWFVALAEMEVLVSTATFAFNHPQFATPLLLEGELKVQAKELSHPLIAPQRVVPNDIAFVTPTKLLLVTGSNMSGKSTFLRTLGLNIVLANAGCVVAASNFAYTPAPVLSSIRVTDSLEENTSLFFQELKQLQHILTQLQRGQAAFVLLDEILRGTNSEDKYNGAFQFLQKLLPLPALTVFATHDLKLCSMEQTHAPAVNNYKFEGVVTNDELHFAYKIERGIVQNRTASFLMRQLGLID